ncbi:tripartite tricarboxylate transporter substrate binding protein [Pseudonocardia zijingensis]|uniref:Tripartite tricarboxylate transporter substrate binding protein n=1 Tax=Pseudonocardia zijingensis TaxID=153376 RepID=A0ABN1PQD1_9PSEU
MNRRRTGRRSTTLHAAAVTVAGAILAAACATPQTAGPDRGAEGGAPALPDRPITMIAAFGAGGGSDQVARAAAQVMERSLGVSVPVVNVPGATGNVGLNKLVTGRPDSMAVLIQDTLATVPLGTSQFQLDQIKAVCRLQNMPSALLVRKDTFGGTWDGLAAAAKERPNEVKVATVGRGGVDDLMLAALTESQTTAFRAVPFAEPSERYAALLSGSVDALYEQLGDVRQYLDSGDFVPVVLFAGEPIAAYQGVPSATDLGIPAEFVLPQFRGVVVHADTDPALIDQLDDACAEVVADPTFQGFQEQVFSTSDSYLPTAEFEQFLRDQEKVMGELLQRYNVAG